MFGMKKKAAMKIPDVGKLRVFAKFPSGPVLMELDGGTQESRQYTCIGAPETGTVSWLMITDENGVELADIMLDSDVAVTAGDTLNVTLDDIQFHERLVNDVEPLPEQERWRFKGF